mgnify:CR=1 FL=1
MVGKSDKDLIKAMCDSLVHRGPDEEGIYIDENVAIGSRRLSIIDLPSGRQPLSNETGNLWITYNGMIYNYLELKKILRERGHYFKTSSDTEVIIHAYEEYGDNCVTHFNGDFAFAIWDTQKKELFAARDRIGVKPFYYFHKNKSFIFASEIKAILQDKNFERKINITSFYNYLSRLSVWGNDTIFTGIRKLPPAHILRFKDGQLILKKYWDLDFSHKLKGSEEEFAECIYQEFYKAVKRRLISDVPLGAFLSGGVDSSSIVAVMSKLSTNPVKTFSFGFTAQNTTVMNELDSARQVAKYYETDHHEFVLDPESLISELPHLIWHFDEPFAGSLPQYFLAEKTRHYAKVVLNGTGGDELFGDYGRSWWFSRFFDNRSLQYSIWPYWMQQLFSNGIHLLPNIRRFENYKRRADEITKNSYRRGIMYADGKDAIFTIQQKQVLLKSWVLGSLENERTIENTFQNLFLSSNARELMDQVFYVDMKTQLVDEYCYWTDVLSMCSSIETRVPFLDYKLIEIIISIPPAVRSRKDNLKYLFQKAMASLVPEWVFTRPKGGLSLPLDDWLRNSLKEMALEMLSKEVIESRGYFNFEYVNILLNDHIRGRINNTYRLWALIMFELWHRIYIDNHSYVEADICSI